MDVLQSASTTRRIASNSSFNHTVANCCCYHGGGGASSNAGADQCGLSTLVDDSSSPPLSYAQTLTDAIARAHERIAQAHKHNEAAYDNWASAKQRLEFSDHLYKENERVVFAEDISRRVDALHDACIDMSDPSQISTQALHSANPMASSQGVMIRTYDMLDPRVIVNQHPVTADVRRGKVFSPPTSISKQAPLHGERQESFAAGASRQTYHSSRRQEQSPRFQALQSAVNDAAEPLRRLIEIRERQLSGAGSVDPIEPLRRLIELQRGGSSCASALVPVTSSAVSPYQQNTSGQRNLPDFMGGLSPEASEALRAMLVGQEGTQRPTAIPTQQVQHPAKGDAAGEGVQWAPPGASGGDWCFERPGQTTSVKTRHAYVKVEQLPSRRRGVV